MMLRRFAMPLVLSLVLLSLGVDALSAQGGQTISGMRDFWHVFVAFGIAWVLVFGWAVAIFRRVGRLEAQLRELEGMSSSSSKGGE
jgi:CcmD family protein